LYQQDTYTYKLEKYIFMRVFTSIIFVLFHLYLNAQPSNDNCIGAILHDASGVQFCQNQILASTLGSTDSGLADVCGGDGDDDVWLKFVALDTTMLAEALPTDGTSDLVVQFFKDNCGSLNSITCNRPLVSTQTEVAISGLTIGDTIRVRIFDAGTGSTNMPFYFCAYAPVGNDGCNGAVEIVAQLDLSVCNSINTYGTSDSGIAASSTCPGTTDDDVWFKFNATQNVHDITLTTAADLNPGGYVVMELRNEPCITSSMVACVQIDFDNQSNTILYNNFNIGETYFVRVFSSEFVSLQGNVCIFTPIPIVPEIEDNCITAELIPGINGEYQSVYDNNLLGSTETAIPLSTCNVGPYFDLWYKFVPTATRHIVTTYISSGSGNLVLDAYKGVNCGSLTQVSCANSSGNGLAEELFLENLVVGDTIYLRIYDASNVATNTVTSISITTPPLNDLCSYALLISTTSGSTCNTPTYGNTQYATGT
jgi:hypothetical protein